MHGIGNIAGVISLSKSIHVSLFLGISDMVAQKIPQQFTMEDTFSGCTMSKRKISVTKWDGKLSCSLPGANSTDPIKHRIKHCVKDPELSHVFWRSSSHDHMATSSSELPLKSLSAALR